MHVRTVSIVSKPACSDNLAPLIVVNGGARQINPALAANNIAVIKDTHGKTSQLSAGDIEALSKYLMSLQKSVARDPRVLDAHRAVDVEGVRYLDVGCSDPAGFAALEIPTDNLLERVPDSNLTPGTA